MPPARRNFDGFLTEMTLAEKLGQLTMASANMATTGPMPGNRWDTEVRDGTVGNLFNVWRVEETAALQRIAVEESRLGIPLLFGFDVIHGHRTIFPIPLGEAAAFDPDLWERTAAAAAEEAALDGVNMTFAPMLDVTRDPRWGRISESAGEDPFVTAVFGRAKVRGFQGEDLADPSRVAATAKHYVAYGGVNAGREYAPVDASDRTLEEVFLPPFREALADGCAAVMPAFTDLAGIPMTAHRALIEGRLRLGWRWEGVVVSDYTAIPELILHGVAADRVEAAALALNAGVDLDMMGFAYLHGLPEALDRGLVTIETIDAAVLRVLRLKERLGLFDDPYARGGPRPEAPPANLVALSREAAAQSAVLLQNDGTLPLVRPRRVAVIGPIADDPAAVLGSWSAAGERTEARSYLAGLRAALPRSEVLHAEGVSCVGEETGGIGAAVALAREADVVVLCLGETADLSGEGGSRARPGLPGRQAELLAAVAAAGRPIVTVLTAGRPLIEAAVFERSNAVLMAWGPGTAGGDAIADVITGRAEPGGRLPVTWPETVGQIPIFFGQRPTGRPPEEGNRYTARYIDGPVTPRFSFGHGLSYATFRYGPPVLSVATLAPGETLEVTVDVENTSAFAGRTTVFLFTRDVVASLARPLLELRGFRSLALEPGSATTVRFTLAADDLAFLGDDLKPVFEPGRVEILAGPAADRAVLSVVTIELEPAVAPAPSPRAASAVA
jgi:beta-glucosidase